MYTGVIRFVLTIFSTSELRVEHNLEKLVAEPDPNAREPSLNSFHTAHSLTTEERYAWRKIRKDMEGVGISIAAFEANRDFIIHWTPML